VFGEPPQPGGRSRCQDVTLQQTLGHEVAASTASPEVPWPMMKIHDPAWSVAAVGVAVTHSSRLAARGPEPAQSMTIRL
jgi:hypothetical protein